MFNRSIRSTELKKGKRQSCPEIIRKLCNLEVAVDPQIVQCQNSISLPRLKKTELESLKEISKENGNKSTDRVANKVANKENQEKWIE